MHCALLHNPFYVAQDRYILKVATLLTLALCILGKKISYASRGCHAEQWCRMLILKTKQNLDHAFQVGEKQWIEEE